MVDGEVRPPFDQRFNCDSAFDLASMGRIFSGLCQTGAWGCFDEFNRLAEGQLSAISVQIQAIQDALRGRAATLRLPGGAGESVTRIT